MIKSDQVDVEMEDRGLIALSILVGKLQVFVSNNCDTGKELGYKNRNFDAHIVFDKFQKF